MRVVYTSKKFKVLQNSKGFIVVKKNNNFYYEHGHFTKLYSAREFIGIIESGELPKSDYYLNCAKRLLNEREFKNLKQRKR